MHAPLEKELTVFKRKLLSGDTTLLFNTFAFATGLVRKKLRQRFVSSMKLHYPDAIRKLVKAFSQPQNTSWNTQQRECPDWKFSAKLLRGNTIPIDSSFEWKETLTEFDDAEETVLLHRFGWLLTQENITQAKQHLPVFDELVSLWYKEIGLQKEHIAWEAYSNAERIVNLVFFHWTTNNHTLNLSESMKAFLDESAWHLSQNLEYRYGGEAFNHVLNNARGLYVAGYLTDQSQYCNLARAIIFRDYDTVFHEDGFSREGSSHYQFVFTRWFLELLWFAEHNNDNELFEFLLPRTQAMVQSCLFFLVKQQQSTEHGTISIPFFGDISPDFPPAFLVSVPYSPIAQQISHTGKDELSSSTQDWAALLPISLTKNVSIKKQEAEKSKAIKYFAQSGWLRADTSSSTLFLHIEKTGTPQFPNHSHAHTGAFVWYLHGTPILIDCGRYNYDWNDPEGFTGVLAQAHNQVTIDNQEPFVYYKSHFFPEKYLVSHPQVDVIKKGAEITVIIKHDGFSRIGTKRITFERRLTIRDNALQIQDFFSGSQPQHTHSVQTYFQFHPSVQSKQFESNSVANTLQLDASEASLTMTLQAKNLQKTTFHEGDDTSDLGWFSEEYGNRQRCTSMKLEQQIQFPTTNTFSFEW